MLGGHLPELLIVLTLALVFFGPKRLPEIGASLGKGIRDFRTGISFELPLALVSLSALGITSSRGLAQKRLYAFFGIFIFSTIVTPGADWISPLILGSILYVFYEASIVVSRFMGK